MNPLFLVGFGLAILAVIVGMACVILAFIVFKPVFGSYANAVAANLKALERAAPPEPVQRATVSVKEAKKDRDKSVIRPMRDVEEEIST